MGCMVSFTLWTPYPRASSGTHYAEGGLGLIAGLDSCGESLSPCLRRRGLLFTHIFIYLYRPIFIHSRSRWPCGLRRGSAAACLLRLWVRISTGQWLCIFCEYCESSCRVLCDGLITRPEESYRMRCAWVWSKNLPQEAQAQQGYRAVRIKICSTYS